MGWTTPTTRHVGDTLDPAVWNEQVRDNFVDVGQPPVGLAINTVTNVGHSASESYSTLGLSTSMTYSKNTSISSNAMVLSAGGLWLISACVVWDATAAASLGSLRAIKLYVNGSPSAGRDVAVNVQNVNTTCRISAYPVVVAAGGFVSIGVWQNSGGTVSIAGSGSYLYAVLESRF